jgi:hypothetical protein
MIAQKLHSRHRQKFPLVFEYHPFWLVPRSEINEPTVRPDYTGSAILPSAVRGASEGCSELDHCDLTAEPALEGLALLTISKCNYPLWRVPYGGHRANRQDKVAGG